MLVGLFGGFALWFAWMVVNSVVHYTFAGGWFAGDWSVVMILSFVGLVIAVVCELVWW